MKHILAFLLLCLCLTAKPQRIVWWNVENLFDCQHDSLKEDYDFLPEGQYHWTKGRYWKKLDNISRTIAAIADEDKWPMIIGLCEVENDTVLRDLTRRSPLRIARYSYIHEEGPDKRGVDVAMLYDSLRFRPHGYKTVRIPSTKRISQPTRDILHVWGDCPSLNDVLHIIIVHLPSRAKVEQAKDIVVLLSPHYAVCLTNFTEKRYCLWATSTPNQTTRYSKTYTNA